MKRVNGGLTVWVSEYMGAYKDKRGGGIIPSKFATWEIWFPAFYVKYIETYFHKGWYVNVKGQMRTQMPPEGTKAEDIHYKFYIAIGQVINVAPNVFHSSWKQILEEGAPDRSKEGKREKESQEKGEPIMSLDDIPDYGKSIKDDFVL